MRKWETEYCWLNRSKTCSLNVHNDMMQHSTAAQHTDSMLHACTYVLELTVVILACGSFTLMLLESVRNMVRRSMPIPQPAVGGNPYSSAVQKVSSMNMASSSPSALAWEKKKKDPNRITDMHEYATSHCTWKCPGALECGTRKNISQVVCTPWLVARIALAVWWDRSTRCKHCRFPSSSQRAQNAPSGLPGIGAWRNLRCQCELGVSHLETVNGPKQGVSHHFARGLMIWGWSQMNVGLMHVTSRKSPTSC